jgi:hypothetical protein
MSDKKKLEDETPEIVADKTDDSADVEGHIRLKTGMRDAEGYRGGEGKM